LNDGIEKRSYNVNSACSGEVAFTLLANDDAVRNIVYGDGSLLKHLAKAAIHISSSTIS
jgi:3-hydroxyisobutyrate dehydrogenase-like beta-hydroxyacid dehydrogenase